MTGVGAPAEKAQPDAHRSPWQGSPREGDGQVGEGEEKGHPGRRHLLGPIGCLDDRHHARALSTTVPLKPSPSPWLHRGNIITSADST